MLDGIRRRSSGALDFGLMADFPFSAGPVGVELRTQIFLRIPMLMIVRVIPFVAAVLPFALTAIAASPHAAPVSTRVELRYSDSTLAELAQDAQRRGGIILEFPRTFAGDRIGRDAHASDWEQGLAHLLGAYNYITVRAPGGALERIVIQARQAPYRKPPDPLPEPSLDGLPSLFQPDPPSIRASPPKELQGMNPQAIAPIQLSVDRLGKMKTGDVLSVRLGDHAYKLVHDYAQAHDGGDRTWIGYVDLNGQAFRAVLTYRPDGAITGFVNTPRGLFEIVQFDGRTWVVDLDASGLDAGSLEHDQLPFSATGKLASALRLTEPAATASAPATVDLMVLHTRPAEAQPMLRIHQLLAASQQALTDSGAFVNLRLVRVERVDYTDNNGNLPALEDLTGNRVGLDVAALRTRYGADLVVMLRPFHSSAQGSCGVSWVGGANQRPLTPDAGFAVVSDGFDDRAYCHDYTFAHELGHVFGNVHDADISPPGIFPFSYAWAVPGKFATIMSYRFNVAPLVGRFANPGVTCGENKLPCGRADIADNARTINLTAPSIAQFVPTAAD